MSCLYGIPKIGRERGEYGIKPLVESSFFNKLNELNLIIFYVALKLLA